MAIAVTASSGRLGHAILRELVRQGYARDVVAVARDTSRVHVPGIELRAGDYESLAGMTTALAGIDTVVMVSAPVAGNKDRIPLHRNVIDAARAAGVSRVLFTSVVGNGQEMDTLFGPTQQVNRQTEADLQASGLNWVVGRNGLYLELDLIQMRMAQESGIYANPAGNGRCPYITIDEIAYAFARLAVDAQHNGQVYNITGETLTQAELLDLVREILGIDLRHEDMSDEACIEMFLELMPDRGEPVALMLAGCFQSMRIGAFDVPSHFQEAAGRPVKSVREMLAGMAPR